MGETQKQTEALPPVPERLKAAGSTAFSQTMLEMTEYTKHPPGQNAFWFLLCSYHERMTKKGMVEFSPDKDQFSIPIPTDLLPMKQILLRRQRGRLPVAVNCLTDLSPSIEKFHQGKLLHWDRATAEEYKRQRAPVYETWGITPFWETAKKERKILRHQPPPPPPVSDRNEFAHISNPRIARIEIDPNAEKVTIKTNWADAEVNIKTGTVTITSRLGCHLFKPPYDVRGNLNETMAGFLVDFFAAFCRNLRDSFFLNQP